MIASASALQSPAQWTWWGVPGWALFSVITLLGTLGFAYIVKRRLAPLLAAAPDPRFDHPGQRLGHVLQFWLAQWRHPRYPLAGVLHILVFAGFLILAARAFTLLILGIDDGFAMPGLTGEAGEVAELIKKHLYHATPLDQDALVKELGDCLWYVAAFANVLGLSLDDVAERNIEKLRRRYPEGFDTERSRNRTE